MHLAWPDSDLCRLLDAVKSVRYKALLVLHDLLLYQCGEGITDGVGAESGEAGLADSSDKINRLRQVWYAAKCEARN